MPDLTMIYKQRCTNSHGTYSIKGSRGSYTVIIDKNGQVSCTCPDYMYRKSKTGEHCKHIDKAYEKEVCQWHEMFSDEVQSKEQKQNNICPVCGSPTEAVKVGV